MSQVQAIGVDLVEVARIRAIHRRYGKKFFDRMLTRAEQQYCLTRSDPYPSIAARIAAKEAISKAMGVGIGATLKWTSLGVENNALGAPLVVLDEAAKKQLKKLKAKEVLLSLSHTHGMAVAMAVLR